MIISSDDFRNAERLFSAALNADEAQTQIPLIYEQDWVVCYPVSWQQVSINIVPKEIAGKND